MRRRRVPEGEFHGRLSSRGQIVIPQALREWAELGDGTTIIFRPLQDGSIVLKVTVNGTMELKRWLFQWGPDCEVLSPPEFRKEVAAELRSMSERYINGAGEK